MEQIISKVTELEHLEKEIIALKNQTAQNIIQIGYKLIEAKEKLQYGEWGVLQKLVYYWMCLQRNEKNLLKNMT